MPQWYMGFEILHYYPPLVYYCLLALTLLIGNTFVAYEVLMFLILFLAAYLTYHVLETRIGWWPALCAARLYILAPHNIRVLFSEGNLPRALSLVALPLLSHLAFSLTEGKPSYRSLAGMVVAVGVAVLAHSMQAAIYCVCLLIFAIVRMLLDPRTRLLHVMIVGVAVGRGLCLSAWWVLPAYLHIELANVPALAGEKIGLFSANWSHFDPRILSRFVEDIYLGLSLLVASTLAMAMKPRRWQIALYGAGVAAVVLAMGTNTAIFRLMPAASMFLPERFLYFGSFALAVVAASAFEMGWTTAQLRRLLLCIALLATLIDLCQARPLVHAMDPPWDYLAICEDLRAGTVDGRVANQFTTGSVLSYLPGARGGKQQVFGWAVEETPHHEKIGKLNYAIKQGNYPFVARQYGLWNVRYVVLNSRDVAWPLHDLLVNDGYTVASRHGDLTLLEKDAPPAYLQRIESRVLAIGHSAATISMLFPWVA